MLCNYQYRLFREAKTSPIYQCEIEDFRNFWRYVDRNNLLWCRVILNNGQGAMWLSYGKNPCKWKHFKI